MYVHTFHVQSCALFLLSFAVLCCPLLSYPVHNDGPSQTPPAGPLGECVCVRVRVCGSAWMGSWVVLLSSRRSNFHASTTGARTERRAIRVEQPISTRSSALSSPSTRHLKIPPAFSSSSSSTQKANIAGPNNSPAIIIPGWLIARYSTRLLACVCCCVPSSKRRRQAMLTRGAYVHRWRPAACDWLPGYIPDLHMAIAGFAGFRLRSRSLT